MKGARALTPAEVRRTLRELGNDRDRALFLLMLHTGARISEAIALEVRDVLRPGAELAIRKQLVLQRRNTKGQRTSRAIDIHPELAGALIVHLAQPDQAHRTAGPLYLAKTSNAPGMELGRAISRTAAWRALHLAFRAAGLEERVSPHSLRKTFAQRLHDHGASLPVIQELLGHAYIEDTIDYFNVSEDQCAAAIRSLPPADNEEPSPDA